MNKKIIKFTTFIYIVMDFRTRFRNYTSLYPLKVESFSELMKIVPINVLRDIELVDEDKSWEY